MLRSLVIGLWTILVVRYEAWRIGETLAGSLGLVVSLSVWAFAALELLANVFAVRSAWGLRLRSDRSREADAHGEWHAGRPDPLVDVFVPTVNEGERVLFRTLSAACRIGHERKRVWVLDDGNRPWVQKLAERLGVRYLSRSERTGFKAGNLTHAYRHVMQLHDTPMFIAVLDADFVALPNILRRSLALMWDPKTAIVQTPQRFFTPDPFQHAANDRVSLPDEQRAWFDGFLPSIDAGGGASCCGTSFLIRVEALEAIGGFAGESLSEDTLTSRALGAAGYRTVYLRETCSFGMATESISGFLAQRARWFLGGVQIALGEHGPLRQRRGLLRYWAFFESVFKLPVIGLARAASFLMPLLYVCTGVFIIPAGGVQLLSYAGPLVLARGLLLYVVLRGTQPPMLTEATNLLLLPVWLRSIWRGLTGRAHQGFCVTEKGLCADQPRVHWRIVAVVGAYLAVLLSGLALAPSRAAHDPLVLGVAWLWSGYLLAVLGVVLSVAVERPRRRGSERFATNQLVHVAIGSRVVEGRLRDLSEDGVQVELHGASAVELASVQIVLPGAGAVPARHVRRCGENRHGLRLLPQGPQRSQLIAEIYTHRYVPDPAYWPLLPAVWALLGGVPRALGRLACALTERSRPAGARNHQSEAE